MSIYKFDNGLSALQLVKVAAGVICTHCKGRGGFQESACGEGCCLAGVMCEECKGTGRVPEPVKPSKPDFEKGMHAPDFAKMPHLEHAGWVGKTFKAPINFKSSIYTYPQAQEQRPLEPKATVAEIKERFPLPTDAAAPFKAGDMVEVFSVGLDKWIPAKFVRYRGAIVETEPAGMLGCMAWESCRLLAAIPAAGWQEGKPLKDGLYARLWKDGSTAYSWFKDAGFGLSWDNFDIAAKAPWAGHGTQGLKWRPLNAAEQAEYDRIVG